MKTPPFALHLPRESNSVETELDTSNRRNLQMLHYENGAPDKIMTDSQLQDALRETFDKLGERKKVLIVPPDYTRFHSNAGVVTSFAYQYYGEKITDIMPALGTHKPMTAEQRKKMFGDDIPDSIFRVHDWRNDVITVGHVPKELVAAASDGAVNEPWPAQVNKLLWEGDHDLILSIGQVVPHEVLGMANHSKNIFVGIGGSDAINFSHFIGACYGMEKMMGQAANPLRKIFDYASDKFLSEKPIVYILTVRGNDALSQSYVTRGLYIGSGTECFYRASKLSLQCNFFMLEKPIHKVVVYLDPNEFHSTWLGNKSIYRTRMAIADKGELIVLAPGVNTFGEDPKIDELIRKYGYRTTPEVMEHVKNNRDLMKNLSAAAHLIHGTSEGRFRIIYCPGSLTKEEVESVGYEYGDISAYLAKYNPQTLQPGWNTLESGVSSDSGECQEEIIYFIPQPATGLWAWRGKFE